MAKRTPDIRKLARRQRWVLWMLLAAIGSQVGVSMLSARFASPVMLIGLVLLQLSFLVLLIVGSILVLHAQGTHPIVTILCAIVMIAPTGNLLLLVLINRSVTRTLRKAGLHVGFMGVKDEEVERVLDPSLCRGCGYNLTGNVSGVCPECGRAVVPRIAGPGA
jgi:hypothetical protein